MTKFSSLIAAAALIFSAGTALAGAGPGSVRVADDEVRPPVFAFSPLSEERALTAVELPRRMWTDDYRPAPPSFYEEH